MNVAAELAFDTEKDAGELGTARSDEHGQAQYLALADGEAYGPVRKGLGANLLDGDGIAARRPDRRKIEGFEAAPDHQTNHRVMGDLAVAELPHLPAVAQHDHPVGTAFYLMQSMRN